MWWHTKSKQGHQWSQSLAKTLYRNIFDDTIKQLYNIKTEQHDDFQKEFTDLDDNDITKLILTVEATVVFNDKNAKEVSYFP